jgi:formylglycine-generating enzyme required for sulfatase activity
MMRRCYFTLVTLMVLFAVQTTTAFADRYNTIDLLWFAQQWQKTQYVGEWDLNADNSVNEQDLLLLIASWHSLTSTTPTPTPTPTPGSATGELIIPLANLPAGAKPLVMVEINAGNFMMGCYPGEQDSYPDEAPQHQVNIGYQFYMGKYEITQAHWLVVMGSWPGTAPSSSYGVGNDYPAYYVSWDDCRNFITELNKLGQGTFRLPSDAEWEYACRADTTWRFYWGDDPSYTQAGDYAWHLGNNTPHGCKQVGGKLPNAWGLYDMSGNEWEWCEDDWHYYNEAGRPDNGSAWVDSTRGTYRVTRGGRWNQSARDCRSASRNSYSPGHRYLYIGFRIVRDAT